LNGLFSTRPLTLGLCDKENQSDLIYGGTKYISYRSISGTSVFRAGHFK
jgi:hypothetical protein